MGPFGPRWTRKPPPGTDLDRTHPLCPDHCWPILSPQGTSQILTRFPVGAPNTKSDVYTGSSSFVPGRKYGWSVRHGAQTDKFILTATDGATVGKVVPLSGGYTMLFAYRKTDATLRVTTAVGVDGTLSGSDCMQVFLPFTDNKIYFDYGGQVEGTTRLSVSATGLTTFGDDLWAFTTGVRGMEIWQNGVKLASNSANPTKTAAGSYFGWPAGTNNFSDLADLAFVMTWRRQLTAAEVRQLYVNPWQVFQPQSQPIFLDAVLTPTPEYAGALDGIAGVTAAYVLGSIAAVYAGTIGGIAGITGAYASSNPTFTYSGSVGGIAGVDGSPVATISAVYSGAVIGGIAGLDGSPHVVIPHFAYDALVGGIAGLSATTQGPTVALTYSGATIGGIAGLSAAATFTELEAKFFNAEPTIGLTWIEITPRGSRSGLLAGLAVAGVTSASDSILAFWSSTGALLGSVTMPTSSWDLGSVAVSQADNRIYALGASDGSDQIQIEAWDGDGVHLWTVHPADRDPTIGAGYALYVPEAGKIWVAIEGGTTGEVWEYDTSGRFVSVVATLTAADGDYLQAAYGMARYGTHLYFNSLHGGHPTAGLWKYDLVGGGDSVSLLALNSAAGLAVTPGGHLLVTQPNDGSTHVTRVRRYDLTGSLLQTYTFGTFLQGVTADADDTTFWVGDNNLLHHVNLSSGTVLASYAAVVSGDSPTSALASGDGSTGGGTGDHLVWSDRPLPDRSTYYGGWKEPRVTTWGSIRRAMSGFDGSYETADFTVDCSDTDRALRALDDSRSLVGATVVVRMIEDAGRRLEQLPRVVFRGVIRDASPLGTLAYRVVIKDSFAETFALVNDPDQVPERLITTDDFPQCGATAVPSSARDYVCDGGAAPAATTVPVRDGAGNFASGDRIVFSGHLTVYTVAVTDWTDPVTTIDVTPALTAGVADAETITVQASHAISPSVGLPVPIVYGHITDRKIDGGLDVGDGQGPLVYVGDEALSDGHTYGIFAWAAHACYAPSDQPFPMIYFWNHALDDLSAGTFYYGALTLTVGDLATEADAGGRIAMPGYANWAACGFTGPNYTDRNGRRYTLIGLRGIFRDWALGITGPPDNLGGVACAVDGYGCDTNADGSGTLIERGYRQYLHALQNFSSPQGSAYQSGGWKASPTFPDDASVSMFDEGSFATADTLSATYVTGGFRGDFILGAGGERISRRELLARFNVSFGCECYFNRHGQFAVNLLNTDEGSTTPVAGLGYVRDIFSGTFDVGESAALLYNVISYRHTQDFFSRVSEGWRSVLTGALDATDGGSVARYGKATSPPLNFYMVRGKNRDSDPDEYQQGTDTSNAVLGIKMKRSRQVPRLPKLQTGPAGANYELGQVVPITHYEGTGLGGWVDRPVRIERIELNPTDYTVTLEGLDLDATYNNR